MKLNTHGYKMTGLRSVCSLTKGLRGYYSDQYVELFYDRATGEVWGNFQVSLGHNWYTVYDNADVIKCGNLCDSMTMQQIADVIADNMYMIEAVGA